MPRFSTVSSRCSPTPLGSKPAISSTTKSSGARRGTPRSAPAAPCARGSAVGHARHSSRHTAIAAMPSPRPVNPRRLGGGRLDAHRIERRLPRSVGDAAPRIASACGPTFGRSHTTVTSTLPTRQPARQQARRNGAGSRGCRHPRQRAIGWREMAGRCRPARARRASHRTAHAAPRRRRNARPRRAHAARARRRASRGRRRRMHGRRSPGRCARSCAHPRPRIEQELGQRQVRRRGHLEVVLAAFDQAWAPCPRVRSPSPRR